MIIVEPCRWYSLKDLGVGAELQILELRGEFLALAGELRSQDAAAMVLELWSGMHQWAWPLHGNKSCWHFEGQLPIDALGDELLIRMRKGQLERPWVAIRVLRATPSELEQWRTFFAGEATELPKPELERISHCALLQTPVQRAADRPAAVAAFCDRAATQELVVEAAGLRHQGQFPSVLGQGPGQILASRLVLNWNLLLVKEGSQRFVVFQGVSSSDAVLLPGLNLLLAVCHLEARTVRTCLAILSRTPEFFSPPQPARFGGYLVGHSRPYHCFYDGLLALQAVREAGELTAEDRLFSKEGEAFVDLGRCLDLVQTHQIESQDTLNRRTEEEHSYLLQLGFWFHTRAEDPELQRLAEAVDGPLRKAAWRDSELEAIGALRQLERCQPIIWVGITGQKRSWVEQVEGTAALLNALQERYPDLGVVFDGWTPPLHSSDYHRREARNDDRVIQKIIRRLNFNTRCRVGVIAGLPLLEKVRVGLRVDAFVANYTTGSLNVARICSKPGVGHMGRRMAKSKHQHIHHHTREIPPELVQDLDDPNTPTGYVNYSFNWEESLALMMEILRPAEESTSIQKIRKGAGHRGLASTTNPLTTHIKPS